MHLLLLKNSLSKVRNKIARIFRLFPVRREKSFLLLEEIVGYHPKDKDLFKLAFTHKSSPIVEADGRVLNNERLEFLGDAILDAIVADSLYKKFPDEKEGFLTNIRARIVNRAFLNKVAMEIQLNDLIVSTSNNQMNNILGNALEALVGAVYLDGGYTQCKEFIDRRIMNRIDDFESFVRNEINFKSKLLEWSQKNRRDLDFEILSETVDRTNTPTFISIVKVDGIIFGKGKGASKKESHQDASRYALKKLKEKKLL